MAGAHIRLGQVNEAVKILEPLTNRFATNYGIRANLGTAYHLQGRYADAERQIARDLEINPDAHFGLEKYHLALLQYLIRDEEYRLRHVYVDEFTPSFLTAQGFYVYLANNRVPAENQATAPTKEDKDYSATVSAELRARKAFTRDEFWKIGQELEGLAEADKPPAYRLTSNLAQDTNLLKGVSYMAELNPHEPACWTMLGMLAVQRSDKNLTIAAFERAIQLGSPQAAILQSQIDLLKAHIAEARKNKATDAALPVIAFVGMILVAIVLIFGLRAIRWAFLRNAGGSA